MQLQDEFGHLQQRLRETEQKLIEKNNELEEKNNEYRQAMDAKEKSYKTMLDIARKPSGGGKSVEWFREVLARGPLQHVPPDESEATLWQVVEEYYVKRRMKEKGSIEVGTCTILMGGNCYKRGSIEGRLHLELLVALVN